MSRRSQPRRTFAMAGLAVFLSAQARASGATGAGACETAGTDAERLHAVPSGLLLAIGRVESGRRDPSTGQVSPWPWTINAAGAGQQFKSGPDALGTTRSLQAQGIRSIDVGCFQVNLQHHPNAFANLEDAFDPHANADYAARFLAALRIRIGSWEAAVAAYHSATPELGGPYRDRVLAGWPRAGAAPVPPLAPGSHPSSTMIWTLPAGQGVRVWTPSAPGAAPSVILIRSAGTLLGQAPRPKAGDAGPSLETHRRPS